jgi:hypothetical protein
MLGFNKGVLGAMLFGLLLTGIQYEKLLYLLGLSSHDSSFGDGRLIGIGLGLIFVVPIYALSPIQMSFSPEKVSKILTVFGIPVYTLKISVPDIFGYEVDAESDGIYIQAKDDNGFMIPDFESPEEVKWFQHKLSEINNSFFKINYVQ